MGQKVNPHGLRVGVISDWDSRLVCRCDKFADYLSRRLQDQRICKEETLQRWHLQRLKLRDRLTR